MTDTLRIVLTAMALCRIAIGVAPFVAAGPLSRIMRFPADQDSPSARLMARFFGVRDAGLGVLVFYALAHPEALAFVALFNALMDGGDLLSGAIPLVRRQGIDRAAWSSSALASVGGLGWLAVWLFTRAPALG